jgi:outer membrane protein assembly factor BamB
MSVRLRLVVACAVALAAAACVVSSRRPPGGEPLWRFPLVEDGRILCEGEINGSFVAGEGGLVVFTTRTGRVYAVDAAKRVLRWEFAARAAVESPPVPGKSGLVIVDGEGGIYGLGWDGKLAWETSRKGISAPNSLALPGKIVLCVDGVNIVALDEETGAEKWQLAVSAPIRSSFASWEDWLVFGTEDKKIQIASSDGRVLSSGNAGGIPVGPAFVDGNILIASLQDTTINGWDLPSLKKRWTIKLGGILAAPPASDGRRLFAVLTNHILFCLAARSGTALWWQALPARGVFGPALAETHVFATTPSTVLLAFPRLGGEKLVAFEASLEARSAPLWLAPHLWVGFLEPETGRTAVVFLKSRFSPGKEKRP